MSSSLLASPCKAPKPFLPKPFLKWAGGKSQLLQQISNYLPEALANGSITTYIEPFLGGGAVFFYIAANYPQVREYYLLDVNPELILAYKTIQLDVERLIRELVVLEQDFISLSLPERINFFYRIRSLFNQQKININFSDYSHDWVQRTAQIIFLNRTCYNGLFRVNSRGYFNVPAGRYKNPTICNRENLRAVSRVLEKATIQLGDFSLIEEVANYTSSFIYFDPPYRPISKTANFTAYSANVFNDEEQLRLSKLFHDLDKNGAKLMLSNSDPKNLDETDNFFDDMYRDYRIERVQAARAINSKSNKRGHISEVLIMNYEIPSDI